MSIYIGTPSGNKIGKTLYCRPTANSENKIVKAGQIGINGQNRVWYYQDGYAPLCSKISVGDTIKMDINGNKRVWRVAHIGNPDPDIYDKSCDGIWLVLSTIYSTRANGDTVEYDNNIIDKYLESTFLKRIDADGDASKFIKQVKIPYAKRMDDGSYQVMTKEEGHSCKVFIPSLLEMGVTSVSTPYIDGAKLDYFDGTANKIKAKLSGTASTWRTRTIQDNYNKTLSSIVVDGSGNITTALSTDVLGVRPCVIMNPAALVDSSGIIIGCN